MFDPEQKKTPGFRWRGIGGNQKKRDASLVVNTSSKGSLPPFCKLGLPGASGGYLSLAEPYRGPFSGWWGRVSP